MKLEIESERVLQAAEECPEWKEGLKTLFPEAFEEGKYFDFSGAKLVFTPPPGMIRSAIQILTFIDDPFREKGFWLSDDYFWTLENAGIEHCHYWRLIPTRK